MSSGERPNVGRERVPRNSVPERKTTELDGVAGSGLCRRMETGHRPKPAVVIAIVPIMMSLL